RARRYPARGHDRRRRRRRAARRRLSRPACSGRRAVIVRPRHAHERRQCVGGRVEPLGRLLQHRELGRWRGAAARLRRKILGIPFFLLLQIRPNPPFQASHPHRLQQRAHPRGSHSIAPPPLSVTRTRARLHQQSCPVSRHHVRRFFPGPTTSLRSTPLPNAAVSRRRLR
ncbi:hypothetical protein DFH11DRAFT_1879303, partial [Phellopilus nigrolimitatus]